MIKASASGVGGCGVDPRPSQTDDFEYCILAAVLSGALALWDTVLRLVCLVTVYRLSRSEVCLWTSFLVWQHIKLNKQHCLYITMVEKGVKPQEHKDMHFPFK